VANEHGLPKRVLANLLRSLAKAGLIEVVMGPFGGCRLGRPLHEVTVLEIVEAVDGPLTGLGTVFTQPRNVAIDRRLTQFAQRANEAGRMELAKHRLSELIGKKRTS
jgi:DNA-binding IscR family transcriptional regulator